MLQLKIESFGAERDFVAQWNKAANPTTRPSMPLKP